MRELKFLGEIKGHTNLKLLWYMDQGTMQFFSNCWFYKICAWTCLCLTYWVRDRICNWFWVVPCYFSPFVDGWHIIALIFIRFLLFWVSILQNILPKTFQGSQLFIQSMLTPLMLYIFLVFVIYFIKGYLFILWLFFFYNG